MEGVGLFDRPIPPPPSAHRTQEKKGTVGDYKSKFMQLFKHRRQPPSENIGERGDKKRKDHWNTHTPPHPLPIHHIPTLFKHSIIHSHPLLKGMNNKTRLDE
jgi:hypothetical protein